MTFRNLGVFPLVIFIPLLLAACGQNAIAANCNGNVASVAGASIPRAEFQAQLRYTLAFYEHGNIDSRYYGFNVCRDATTKGVCRSIKQSLVKRMIDQQIVSGYAARHNLIPTGKELTGMLQKESRLVRNAGGQAAFIVYLHKIDSDQAQFRYLEGQEIETLNVERSMDTGKFRVWLTRQERSASVTHCPLNS